MPAQLLLRTPPPYEDESLAGYLIRLSESNYYDSPNWILQLAGLQINRGILLAKNPYEPSQLSQLIQMTDEQITVMASLPHQLVANMNSHQYTVYKFALKLCPYCLIELPYCRKIWDWDLVQACYLHQCVLVKKCPSCHKNIKWSRPAVTRCRCGFDFRSGQVETASSDQVNLSAYLSKFHLM
ncbi:TniQ family protein [Nodularia spumigena]|uniref:TniQ family protein n=1 Tax=Nodularia spumigena TaxID=70799 RepID=UPI00232F7684|nr:TniQ family protein [Nodularia spumigena]MDB9323933.1 TniQ family protein [Nodularia spumigena CS-591/07A]MDB9329299.1 TniQ family protein [Nodularia spumigena CS-591/04]MDB9336522.1 TniQ family protein [Nodularia spumigena CS-590/01]MDB9361692.1 TniQ family protein [Nodularia spumigena CS-588/02]MDB9364660.1 TniQ family protein [Nodularia spumigena CS-588/02A10]